jgi:hypothetical protein
MSGKELSRNRISARALLAPQAKTKSTANRPQRNAQHAARAREREREAQPSSTRTRGGATAEYVLHIT